MEKIPRPEYPRMQFMRDEWINLNGTWSYEFDFGESGADIAELSPAGEMRSTWDSASSGMLDRGLYDNKITVPFCPESELSGVGYKDFIPAMFYAREVTVPDSWQGKRTIIHFGGVDNIASLYIDGVFAGRHKGGQGSFEFDITSLVHPGEKQIFTLHVIDHTRSGLSGVGKQSQQYKSHGCSYTRVTGIWSTVWLEAVAPEGLKCCRITPNFDEGTFVFTPEYYSLPYNGRLEVEIFADGKSTAKYSTAAADGVPFCVKPGYFRPWTPDDPFLYEIVFKVYDQAGVLTDQVKSYSGMRKISIIKDRFYLNNKPLFLRFVLDQGYFPDGIWTAPDDESLKNDILRSKAAGFNGARLHQRVFDERFHYHADRLGYLTSAEYGNWGLQFQKPQARENFLGEWREIVRRDINHPSIITWCPLNETKPPFPLALAAQFPNMAELQDYRSWLAEIVNLTKMLDPGRPASDTSGFLHAAGDIWSVHCYCRDAAELRSRLFPADGGVMYHAPSVETGYCGQPYLCNEFGGFMYIQPEKRSKESGWGYFDIAIETPQELCEKIREQVEVLISEPAIAGYCYTQLTDIEQEKNGIYNYDRTEKFPPELVYGIFSRKPDWAEF